MMTDELMDDEPHMPPDHQASLPKALLAIAGGIVIACAGLSIAWTHWMPGLVGWWQTRNWHEVPCKIVYSHLKETTTSRGRRHVMTDALYTYEAGGLPRKGRRVSLITGWGGGYEAGIHARLRPYEISQEPFRCLVNPADPEDAVVFRDLRWGLLASMSIPLALFPWLGVQVCWVSMTSLSRSWCLRGLRQRYPGQPWKWQPEWAGAEITASPDGFWPRVVTCIWLVVVTVPLVITVLCSGILSAEPEALVVFLLLAAAAWPLVLARRRWRARQVMGKVSIIPEKWPAKPKGRFLGQLKFTKLLPPGAKLMLRAGCQHEIPQQRSTAPWGKVLWDKSWEAIPGEGGTAFVDVMLPAHPRSPYDSSATNKPVYRWFLEVSTDDEMTAVSLPLPIFREDHKRVSNSSSGIENGSSTENQKPRRK